MGECRFKQKHTHDETQITTGVTSGAGTANASGARKQTPVFNEFFNNLQVFCVVFCILLCFL
jgi:hypothetical protein